MNILIVEDDTPTSDAIVTTFEFEYAFIHAVSNGSEALKWLLCHPKPTVILLDLMMPIMSGYEFLEIIREHSDLARIPVVVMTAMRPCDIDLTGYCLHAVLHKPINIELLEAAILSAPPQGTETTRVEAPSPARLARVRYRAL